MAGVDKLYLKSWYTFDELVRWSIAYYPKLLNYMYDWRMTYKDWEKSMKASIKTKKKINARELEKIGGKDVSLRDGIYNLIDHYRKEANYECSYEQAKEEVEYKVTVYYMPSSLPISAKNFSFSCSSCKLLKSN